MSDYETLKAAGHSPFKAAEIALDAKRGDIYAVQWVAASRASNRASPIDLLDAKQGVIGTTLQQPLPGKFVRAPAHT